MLLGKAARIFSPLPPKRCAEFWLITRAKHREKRGGDNVKLSLEDATLVAAKEKGVDLIALDEALNKLVKFDEQQARIVELRYFSGLSLEETAEALHISRATVARDWEAARAWLHREMTK